MSTDSITLRRGLVAALLFGLAVSAPAQDPVPPCAGIDAVVPAQTYPLGGDSITLMGWGLDGVGSVWVDGVPLPADAWAALSSSEIVFTAPPSDALGTVPVQIWCFGGSDVETLVYVAPSSPLLLAPAEVSNGDDVSLAWSAAPAQVAWLLLDTTGATIPFHGQPVVVYQLLVPGGPTDPASGVGGLDFPHVQGLPVGLVLYVQLVTVAPGGGSATIEVSDIRSITVVR